MTNCTPTPMKARDRFIRAPCIEHFDRHCPFVASSVGLCNCLWFLLFLTNSAAYFTLFWIVFVMFIARYLNKPWVAIYWSDSFWVSMPCFQQECESITCNCLLQICGKPQTLVVRWRHPSPHSFQPTRARRHGQNLIEVARKDCS